MHSYAKYKLQPDMNLLKIAVFKAVIIFPALAYCQIDTVRLNNPSFEDTPKKGGDGSVGIKGWFDCGQINFPGESPPDIHPNGYWQNNLPASDGKTYLGMVVRNNNTYESVSQRLETPLEPNKCYSFSINLARAENYWSPTRLDHNMHNYVTPAVLRIWGGKGFCNDQELLAESAPVSNFSWQIFKFEFQPKNTIRYITFEAFYKTPVLLPYNGNILVDGASEIIQIACPGEPPLIAKANTPDLPPHKRRKTQGASAPQPAPEPVLPEKPTVRKVKLLPELSISTIKEGQTIELRNLYFAADASTITKESYEALDELFEFLLFNKDVVIEIGGHTNGLPPDDYCDQLSTARAKAVAEYLIKKGIDPSKLQFKGYGKKQPIASDKTAYGRNKNQRVEIKILSLSKVK